MNIFDCFMYFDEDMLLDIRLNSLDNFVKKFVITEATYTHNGNKKKLNFDIKKFKKFEDKIIYIIIDDQPKNILELKNDDTKEKRGEKLILNGMARDYYQREKLTNGLSEALDDDIILISDLDEIPNLENLNFQEINNQIVIFEQKILYYKLNLLYDKFLWQGTKAVKNKKWRLDTFFSKKKYSNLMFVKNGGWHFTCLRTPEQLEKKLLNYAHHYEFQESGLKFEDIKKFISEKRVIYDYNADQKKYKWSGGATLKKISNDNLPNYISNNLKKFADWLD